ncbi:hypothetical protein Ndes2526B_g08836 [Nannochloris sp. 'desiccata']|nr:hypothetical protein KSW81_001597 [Chlorella desiccata (nom. nud.)]KAH7616738.1 putative Eukaryotic translation initiation factor 3 subunit F [Chlorella desiccata (nom. nud.)]
MAGPAPLTLPAGVTENSVKVHPVVLFTICDAYIRRNEGQARVIGTLLGKVGDGIIDIRNCYAVPHTESEQVAVDVMLHHTMAGLQQKVNPGERIVGWFSTGTDVSGSNALIHTFYTNECVNPVHLVVDTTLQDNKMSIKSFVSRSLSIQGRELAREFQEVPCEVRSIEAERAGGDLLLGETIEKLPNELEGLASSLSKLQNSLEAAETYVNEVVSGKRQGSVLVGRHLAEAVATVPHFSAADLAKLLQDSQNDVLLTSYLAGLIRAHISLADKLGTMQLPVV